MFPTSCRRGGLLKYAWGVSPYDQYVNMCIYIYTHIHIYTDIHIHIHIYIYIHTYTCTKYYTCACEYIHVLVIIHIYTCVFIIYILRTSTHTQRKKTTIHTSIRAASFIARRLYILLGETLSLLDAVVRWDWDLEICFTSKTGDEIDLDYD